MCCGCYSGDKNSMDHQPPTPRHPVLSTYDEQEMSVDMLNDEFDHYAKSTAAARPPRSTSDIYLHSNNSHSNNGRGVVRNGKPPAPPPPSSTTNGRANGSTSNGLANSLDHKKRHMYDNHGFEMQATEI